MMMYKHQTRGMVAVIVLLAYVPLIVFISSSMMVENDPVLSRYHLKDYILEIDSEEGPSGIYFVKPGTDLRQLLSHLELHDVQTVPGPLKSGMKLTMIQDEHTKRIVFGKIAGEKRLALGLPLDVNLAAHNELILIPGIGEVLAKNIIARRQKIGRFKNMDQLMDIPGIKGKKLSRLTKYLNVEISD